MTSSADKTQLVEDQQILVDSSVLLALSETGIGSLLHAWSIPFSGYFLSLNQIFLMTRSYQKGASLNTAFQMSLLAASIKSLSFFGKKLTPMLAITMQGALFNLGVVVLGKNRLGFCFGALLASSWGFIQPLIIYICIFGIDVLAAYRYAGNYFNFNLNKLFLCCLILKAMIAIAIVLFSSKKQEQWIEQIIAKTTFTIPYYSHSIWKGILKDICSFSFLATLLVTLIWLSQVAKVESFWTFTLLRIVGVGFLTITSLNYRIPFRIFVKITKLSPFTCNEVFFKLKKNLTIGKLHDSN